MKDDQFIQVLQALKSDNEKNKVDNVAKIADVAFRMLTTISFALSAWVLMTVIQLQQDITRLSSDSQYMRQTISKLDEFTSKPRFAKEDFDLAISPVLNIIQQNKTEVELVEKRMNEIDLKIQQLQLSVQRDITN